MSADTADELPAKRPSNAPLWTTTSGRVDGSIWRHERRGGISYSFSPSRSYYDKKKDEWKRVHFFDRQDLSDLAAVLTAAEAYLKDVADKVDPA